jgi:hypothetical protein
MGMSTSRFETKIKAIHAVAQTFTVDKAVSTIEGWEEYLSKREHAGVNAVMADLGKQKKLLQKDELDGGAIKTMLQKLGKDTTAVAGDKDTAGSKKIKQLGAALEKAA